jgi:hypothetical protein
MSQGLLPRTPVFAAIKKAEGPIPDLRPPREQLSPEVPEAAILNGAIFFAFLVLIVGRMVQLRKPLPPPVIVPPAVVARRALEAAGGPNIVADCAQIVRRYLHDKFGIGPEGATTRELCAAYALHPAAQTDALAVLTAYLSESDLALFAPLEAPFAETCVGRALEVIERLETRPAAVPPPLPIPT